MNKSILNTVGVIVLTFLPFTLLAQATFYGGHAGQGGGEANPGAFSTIDLTTGQATVIGVANNTGGGVAGLAFDGTTIFAALAVNGAAQLVTIDTDSGTVDSTIGDVILDGGGPCAIGDLAMGGDGILYGMTANGRSHVCDGQSGGLLVTINTQTGAATAVGRPYGSDNRQGGLAVDGDGNLWFSPGWNHPAPGSIHILDTTDGQILSTLNLSGDFPQDEGANGLAWNPEDGLLYASFEQRAPGNTSLWSIDPASGASVLITDSTAQLHDMVSAATIRPPVSIQPMPVPINSTWLIALLATLLGFLGLQRSRKTTRMS